MVPLGPCSWLMIVPLSAIGRLASTGMIRLRIMKFGLLMPFWKVAMLPAGRKSIGGPPIPASFGFQLTTALGESTRMVSVVGPVVMRVAEPSATAIEPWKAWAWAGWGALIIQAMAATPDERSSRW